MDELLKEKIKHFINDAEPFIQHNHIRVMDADDGMAVVEAQVQDESMNRWASPHGGLLFTLGDMAAGTATLTLRQEQCVTLNASIHYIAAVGHAKRLVATGRVRQGGGRVNFCDVDIRDESGALAAQLSTVMYFTGEKLDL